MLATRALLCEATRAGVLVVVLPGGAVVTRSGRAGGGALEHLVHLDAERVGEAVEQRVDDWRRRRREHRARLED